MGPVRAVVAALLLVFAPPFPVLGLALPLLVPPFPVLGLVLPPLHRPQLLSQTCPSGIHDSLQVPHSTHCEHGMSGLSGLRLSVHSATWVVELEAASVPPEAVPLVRDDVEDVFPPLVVVAVEELRLEVPPEPPEDLLVEVEDEVLVSFDAPPESSSVVELGLPVPPFVLDVLVPPAVEPPRLFADERDWELVEPREESVERVPVVAPPFGTLADSVPGCRSCVQASAMERATSAAIPADTILIRGSSC